ncbi:hypothetical protein [Flavobacterium sp. 140616W15]|uniref:hypothetical protein n=1 Tax=Flavobacterium sp. 140616W15 TaxID=2478552 RepID=UPI000F0C03C8|nr:hypothetical protein [Flavobacterium sp. 140616W15]AYN04520.1 hypothetical protein EAG11_10330 [Flavobacterium sp. 140616W15]
MNKCKLCGNKGKLVKSHIIPKFMFKKMKDEDNVFYEIIYDPDTNTSKSKKTQIEDYDRNILCENCDNKILGGIYESYAQKALYGGSLPVEVSPECKNYKNSDDGAEYSICKNFDYQKIKNFYLSILWRASITDRSFFNQVNLGKKHEERIREILFNNEKVSEDEYPIVITSFMRTENTLENLIAQPKRIKTKSGLNGYIFLIDSLQFIIYVNSHEHKLTREIKQISLKEEEMVTLHLPKGKEIEFLKILINK